MLKCCSSAFFSQVKSLEERVTHLSEELELLRCEKCEIEQRNTEHVRVMDMQKENVQRLLDEALQQKCLQEQESEHIQQALQAEIDAVREELQEVSFPSDIGSEALGKI